MQLSGHYSTVATLGVGGMASVYLVRHEGRLYALKVLDMPTGRARHRFRREGALQQSLRHPNVVGLLDVLELEGGHPALLMEYVRGPTLAHLVARHALRVEQVDALARPILRGVAAAHAIGLVHRDLKPSNVLVEVGLDALIPKVSDFGIAKLLTKDASSDLTRTGALLGTPRYMAPEQIVDSASVDQRADIFSLGVLLYELATGRLPFGERGAGRDCDPTPVSVLRPGLPARMERAIGTALAWSPDRRWSSCQEMLDAWTDGTVEPAGPDVWPAGWLSEVAEASDPLEPTSDPMDLTALDSLLNTRAERPRPRASRVGRLPLVGLAAAISAGALWTSTRRVDPPEVQPTFVRLTFNPADRQVVAAALSPDGERLLTSESTGLFLRGALPGPSTALELPTEGRPGAVTWCGDAVAVSVWASSSERAVWWAETAHGPWRHLVDGADVLACSWDGERLLVRTEDELRVLARDGSTRLLASGGFVASAAFSPDGEVAVFTRVTAERTALERVAVDGSSEPVPMRDDVLPHGVAWARDGTLLLLRERAEELDDRWATLVAVDATSSQVGVERTIATRVGPAAEQISVSRDGSRLVYLTTDRGRNMGVFHTQTGTWRPITRTAADTFAAGWLDERRVAYADASSGALDLYVRDLVETQPVALLTGPASTWGATAVPGTDTWLYARRASRGTEIVRAGADGEEVLRWYGSIDELARRPTRCAADVGRCFSAAVVDGALEVSTLPPAPVRTVARLDVEWWRPFGWDVDATGSRIAWTSPAGLSIVDLATGQVRDLGVDGALQGVAWSVDGTRVWGTGMDFGGSAYSAVAIDPTDGSTEIVYTDTAWLSHLSASPDGARLAWTRTTYDVVAWMAELHGASAAPRSTRRGTR